jgi:hypothetical protein
MCRSSLYERAGTDLQKPAETEDLRHLSAKLHCLFGIPSSNTGRRVLSTHPYARSRVYDLRNYTDKTAWGPFRDDGSMRVDWEMVESLMIVLGYNSGLCCRRFEPRFSPPWSDVLQGVVPSFPLHNPAKMLYEPEIPLAARDPYNVSGVWSRVSYPFIFQLSSRQLVLISHPSRSYVSSTTTTSTPSTSAPRPSNTPPTPRATPSSPTKQSATSSWTCTSPPSSPPRNLTIPLSPSCTSPADPAP